MKQHFTLLAILFFTLCARAQDDNTIFQRIEKTGAAITSMECNIVNTCKKSGEERSKPGKLYYQASDKIGAHFDCGDYAIFNGSKMKIDIGIFHGTFRTNRENIFNSLSNMLFCAIQGKCIQVAETNDYDYALETREDTYVVNFDSRKQKSRGIGYKNVVFVYGKSNCRLVKLILTDFKGTTNTFSFSNIQYGCKIDGSKFSF